MRPAAYEVYVGAKHFMGDNWCSRCPDCKKALSRYAFTEAEARAEGEKAAVAHACPKKVAA